MAFNIPPMLSLASMNPSLPSVISVLTYPRWRSITLASFAKSTEERLLAMLFNADLLDLYAYAYAPPLPLSSTLPTLLLTKARRGRRFDDRTFILWRKCCTMSNGAMELIS